MTRVNGTDHGETMGGITSLKKPEGGAPMKHVRWILPVAVAATLFFKVEVMVGIPSYFLTISIKGNGAVEKDPNDPFYYNELVTLTAVPGEGCRFVQWEGDLTGSSNPGSIYMDDDKDVTAVFSSLAGPAGKLLLLEE